MKQCYMNDYHVYKVQFMLITNHVITKDELASCLDTQSVPELASCLDIQSVPELAMSVLSRC